MREKSILEDIIKKYGLDDCSKEDKLASKWDIAIGIVAKKTEGYGEQTVAKSDEKNEVGVMEKILFYEEKKEGVEWISKKRTTWCPFSRWSFYRIINTGEKFWEEYLKAEVEERRSEIELLCMER